MALRHAQLLWVALRRTQLWVATVSVLVANAPLLLYCIQLCARLDIFFCARQEVLNYVSAQHFILQSR